MKTYNIAISLGELEFKALFDRAREELERDPIRTTELMGIPDYANNSDSNKVRLVTIYLNRLTKKINWGEE